MTALFWISSCELQEEITITHVILCHLISLSSSSSASWGQKVYAYMNAPECDTHVYFNVGDIYTVVEIASESQATKNNKDVV